MDFDKRHAGIWFICVLNIVGLVYSLAIKTLIILSLFAITAAKTCHVSAILYCARGCVEFWNERTNERTNERMNEWMNNRDSVTDHQEHCNSWNDLGYWPGNGVFSSLVGNLDYQVCSLHLVGYPTTVPPCLLRVIVVFAPSVDRAIGLNSRSITCCNAAGRVAQVRLVIAYRQATAKCWPQTAQRYLLTAQIWRLSVQICLRHNPPIAYAMVARTSDRPTALRRRLRAQIRRSTPAFLHGAHELPCHQRASVAVALGITRIAAHSLSAVPCERSIWRHTVFLCISSYVYSIGLHLPRLAHSCLFFLLRRRICAAINAQFTSV